MSRSMYREQYADQSAEQYAGYSLGPRDHSPQRSESGDSGVRKLLLQEYQQPARRQEHQQPARSSQQVRVFSVDPQDQADTVSHGRQQVVHNDFADDPRVQVVHNKPVYSQGRSQQVVVDDPRVQVVHNKPVYSQGRSQQVVVDDPRVMHNAPVYSSVSQGVSQGRKQVYNDFADDFADEFQRHCNITQIKIVNGKTHPALADHVRDMVTQNLLRADERGVVVVNMYNKFDTDSLFYAARPGPHRRLVEDLMYSLQLTDEKCLMHAASRGIQRGYKHVIRAAVLADWARGN